MTAAVIVLPAGGVAQGQAGPAAASVSDAAAATPLEQAEESAQQAQDTYDHLTGELDALASQYEMALAHAERLQVELEDADDDVAIAQAELHEAEAARRAHIREAYKDPAVDLTRRSAPFLAAADIGTALHVSRMMEMVADAKVEVERRAERAADNSADNIASQQGILNGTGAAMEDLRTLGSVFSAALDDAATDIVATQDALDRAEEAAERAEALSSLPGVGGSIDAGALGLLPAPALRQATIPGGTQVMACPLGAPNGFIDSWGFPRSGGRSHKGVDMFAAYGMPIYATAEGVVTRVYNNRLGGLSIDLVDRLGNRYYYAHLSAAFVLDNQVVAAGQLLAANGNSGNAAGTPPHLHWQFHPYGGQPINPFPLAAALCR